MLDLREQTFGGTFLFGPRYLDRDGLSLHYVDEGAGAPVLFVGRRTERDTLGGRTTISGRLRVGAGPRSTGRAKPAGRANSIGQGAGPSSRSGIS